MPGTHNIYHGILPLVVRPDIIIRYASTRKDRAKKNKQLKQRNYMPIENGNIYILPLAKKIQEHNLLIFDIDGQSGRLHISELSNDRTLSLRMFELFEVGQEVYVIIKGYNKDKNYFELSTKEFRNSLDDTLSFNRCRQIIRRELKEYADLSSRHIQQYRAILDRLRGDLSSTGLTFLYELLQNAVDHPNTNFNNEVSVHFEIFENYLLLKHNGALFTENNFRSITGILFGEQDDEHDVRRIGYKGIGFKSVFRHSTNVYVRSGNFSFAFTKETGDEKPWEVMPIFQNEIDKITEIKQFDFFNSPVAFALEFPNKESKENVINYLKELSANPYLLIFLKKLIRLKITLPTEERIYEKEIVEENGRETIKLKQSDGSINDWIRFTGEYLIEEEGIIQELSDENNKSVPSNFRNFRTPKIDIVIPKEVNTNMVNLFTYLPMSDTQYQLPYIVNGDFIPNLDRTNLISTLEYNYRIADFVAEELLKSCTKLAKNKQYEYLKKLIPTYELGNNRYASTVQGHFINEVNNHYIFPTSYSEDLFKLDNLVVDKTGLQNVLSEGEYETVCNTKKKPLTSTFGATTELEYLIERTQKGVCFTIDDLKKTISTEEFQNWLKKPENNAKFIKHIIGNEDLGEILREPIFLTNSLKLKKSIEIYKQQPDAIPNFDVDVLHDITLTVVTEESIKFKEYKILAFLNEIISQKNDDKENIKRDWEWIYDNWEEIKKDEERKKALTENNIICKNDQLSVIKNTYVSDEFQDVETNKIETIIESLQLKKAFITADLVSPKRENTEWLKIFKTLKAKANLQDVITDIIANLDTIKDEPKHFKIAQEIFKYWNKKTDEANNLQKHLDTLRANLKVKTSSGHYCIPSNTIISDHYLTGKPFEDVLSSIELDDNISNEYDTQGNNSNWFSFFKEILNCKNLTQTQEVFDAKVEYYLINQTNKELREKHYEILREIANIFFNKRENNIDFDKTIFSRVEFETHTNEWKNATELHLSSKFCKTEDLDLQKDQVQGVYFLSDRYTKKNLSRGFFKMCGVKSSFSYKIKDYSYSDCPDTSLANRFKSSKEFEHKYSQLRQRYSEQQILGYSTICNYVTIGYLKLIDNRSYFYQFTKFIKSNKQKKELFDKTYFRNNRAIYAKEDNNLIKLLKANEIINNFEGAPKKTVDLFSNKFKTYLDNSLLATDDWIELNVGDSETSLEEAIGIQQTISQEIALVLISDSKPNLTEEDVTFLNLIDILEKAELDDKQVYYLPNKNYKWKPCTELFQVEEEFSSEIKESKILHPTFEKLAETFSIINLSQDSLEVVKDEINDVSAEIKSFFEERAKYISFKIDNENWAETEVLIKAKIEELSFKECTRIKYVLPNEPSKVLKEIDFLEDGETIFFTGIWKQNNHFITRLNQVIDDENLTEVWLKNLIIRWNEKQIISNLKGEFEVPKEWEDNVKDDVPIVDENTEEKEIEEKVENPFKDVTSDDETFIRGIIKGVFELNEKLDANTTAKIKALLKIKNLYPDDLISDEEYYLQVGELQILVRSAQKGLLFLDLNHWERLEQPNVCLSIYTNNEIIIFESQEELFEFAKPQNTYGVLKMPDDYDLKHLNSVNAPEKEGVWRFVFIVNENTKAAQSYKEATNIYDYDF